jgi:hypothetical protein
LAQSCSTAATRLCRMTNVLLCGVVVGAQSAKERPDRHLASFLSGQSS